MSQFTDGRTAASFSFVLAGLLVAGIALAGSATVEVTATHSTLPDRVAEPLVAAADPDPDPQDATSPVAPARVDAAPDIALPPVEEADPAPPKLAAPRPVEADGAGPADEPGHVPTTTATSAAATGDSQLARVEAMADRLPFDWRAAGATFRIGCAPERSTCHWGLYTAEHRVIWVSQGAFESDARLFYVVAHETAHAWQYANDPHARMDDMKDWHRTGVDGLEAAADCLANVWGAATTYYWNCPSDARQHMQHVFASTQ